MDIAYKKRQWVDMPIAMSSLSDTQEPRQDYETAGNLVIRVDAKKKELLGNFYREGRLNILETLDISRSQLPLLIERCGDATWNMGTDVVRLMTLGDKGNLLR